MTDSRHQDTRSRIAQAVEPGVAHFKRVVRMTELTLRHKRTLGETRHVVDTHSFFEDIVPSAVTEVIEALAAELGPLPPVHVTLRKDDHAIYGWPEDGIAEKIRADGGSIRFGWRMREWPGVLLTAEPHAVWVDPEGTLIDVTPDVKDGDTSLFVPVASYPEPFGPDRRPPTRYRVLHSTPDRSAAVAERIALMKPGQRAYEERRAQKASMTLDEWIRDKYYHDPLPGQIAAFIEACGAFDARLPTLPGLIENRPNAADDEADEDRAIDDDEQLYDDETADAVDALDRWSRERDAVHKAILRTLAGV